MLQLKESTVGVILGTPHPCKDGNVQFTTGALNVESLCLIKYELDIHVLFLKPRDNLFHIIDQIKVSKVRCEFCQFKTFNLKVFE